MQPPKLRRRRRLPQRGREDLTIIPPVSSVIYDNSFAHIFPATCNERYELLTVSIMCYEFFLRRLILVIMGLFTAGSRTSLNVARIYSRYLIVNELSDHPEPAWARTAVASTVRFIFEG